MTADEIKTLLKLDPHPVEGGFFKRTYTAQRTVEGPQGTRALEPRSITCWNRARFQRCMC